MCSAISGRTGSARHRVRPDAIHRPGGSPRHDRPGIRPLAFSWRISSASGCSSSLIRSIRTVTSWPADAAARVGRRPAVGLPSEGQAELVQAGDGVAVRADQRLVEQREDPALDRLAHHVLPAAGLDVQSSHSRPMTSASSRSASRCLRITAIARWRPCSVSSRCRSLGDVHQPVALHPGDGLADGRAALAQPLGDPGAQRRRRPPPRARRSSAGTSRWCRSGRCGGDSLSAFRSAPAPAARRDARALRRSCRAHVRTDFNGISSVRVASAAGERVSAGSDADHPVMPDFQPGAAGAAQRLGLADHSSNRATGQVLTIRSTGTPHSAARAPP